MVIRELIAKLGFKADWATMQRWNRALDQTKGKSKDAFAAGEKERREFMMWMRTSERQLDRLGVALISGRKGMERFHRALDAQNARRARKEFADLLMHSPRLMDRFVGRVLNGEEALRRLRERMTGVVVGLGQMGARIGLLGAGAGVAALGGLGIAATRKASTFEDLRAGLITANSGNESAADATFERVRKFAADAPFTVEQITDAVLRLKNLGLDTRNAVLTSFGNIAASFPGKTIIDFIEAVADATTFEFERLKEFGIKTKQEGDSVFFTFRGVTTEVKKTADDVQKYLQRIGDTAFAGAMQNKMKTFSGVMSNLQDAWDSFLVRLAGQGLLEEMTKIGKELTSITGDSDDLAKALGGLLTRSVRDLWDLFKDLRPELEDLVKSMAEFGGEGFKVSEAGRGVIDFLRQAIDLVGQFVQGMGGLENTFYAIAPAIAVLTASMWGLTAPFLILAAAAAAVPKAIQVGEDLGDWMIEKGIKPYEQTYDRREGVKATHDPIGRDQDANVILVGSQKSEGFMRTVLSRMSPSMLDDAASGYYKGRFLDPRAMKIARELKAGRDALVAGVGGALDSVSGPLGDIRRKAQLQTFVEGASRIADRVRTSGILDNVAKSVAEDEAKKAGKKKAKKKSAKKRSKKDKDEGMSLEEILERDFGGGLGQRITTDDGRKIRPTLGTTINKITAHFNPEITQTFEVVQRPGETGEAFRERVVIEAVDRRIGEVFREGARHFEGSVKT